MNGGAASDGAASGDRPFVARVRPEIAAVGAACDGADAHAASCGADERARYALRLVLEELLTNVAKYASARGDVGVQVDADASAIRIRVDDDGVAFDPTRVADAAPPGTLDAAKVGGLGVKMVRGAVRTLRYRREDGRNVVEAEIAAGPLA